MHTKATPIRRLVFASLTNRWPETPITEPSSGEPGTAALATAKHQGAPVPDATLARPREMEPNHPEAPTSASTKAPLSFPRFSGHVLFGV